MLALSTISCGAILALALTAAPVQAQAFIATNGADSNSCVRTAPCRTLQRGVNATSAGRELTVITSGEYGPATISRSITITATGVSANIRVPAGGTAIAINNTAAKVALRGLLLAGGGVGATGVFIIAGAAVHIEDCTIERFTGHGILLDGSDTELSVVDSTSRDNGGDGLHVTATGTSATLAVDSSRFFNNAGNGLHIEGIPSAITDSVVSGNARSGIIQLGGEMTVLSTTVSNSGLYGIDQQGGTANIVGTTAADNSAAGYFVHVSGQMTLESSLARGNNIGLYVYDHSLARISNSTFTNNETGIDNYLANTLLTRRNNTLSGNVTDLKNSGTVSTLTGF